LFGIAAPPERFISSNPFGKYTGFLEPAKNRPLPSAPGLHGLALVMWRHASVLHVAHAAGITRWVVAAFCEVPEGSRLARVWLSAFSLRRSPCMLR
jgi:hypothetical protein